MELTLFVRVTPSNAQVVAVVVLLQTAVGFLPSCGEPGPTLTAAAAEGIQVAFVLPVVAAAWLEFFYLRGEAAESDSSF